ncbi:MAG: protein kinase [Spirulina sp. SIO3F2]|nr:protein kinase [Spirulina sp. SIO3F2]
MQAQAFDPWQIGELLCGQYRIVERLSQNTQQLTYRAYHEAWHQPIRLKVFPRHLECNKANAEAWSTLSLHPSIASCYYVREIQGHNVIVSEYIRGVTGAHLLARQRERQHSKNKPLATLFDVAIQTAWGLQYAHNRGICHGNWQLNNLIQTPTGKIRITDFKPASATTHTEDARVWVQLLYIWSQQLVHCPTRLGNTLQQWSDNPSFTWPNCLQLLYALYHESFGQPYPQTPPKAEQWQMSGLNNQAVALMDLEQSSVALGYWEQVLKMEPSHPESLYNQGLWQWRSQQISRATFIKRLNLQTPNAQAWVGFIHLEGGDGAAALAAFEQWQPDPGQSAKPIQQARALAQQCLKQTAHHSLPISPSASIQRLIYSQDGRFVIWGDAQGSMGIWDVQLAQGTRLAGHAQGIVSLSLTPDNCYLVSIAQAGTTQALDLKLWSFRTGKCLTAFPALNNWQSLVEPVGDQHCRWSADGRYGLLCSETVLTLIEKATGQVIFAIHADLNPIVPLLDRSTGLSWNRNNAQVIVWDLVRQIPQRSLSVSSQCSAIAVMPPKPKTPESYLTIDPNGQLTQWSLRNGQCLATWSTTIERVKHIQVSQDQQQVLLQGKTVSLWSLSQDQLVQTVESPAATATVVALSPNLHSILCANQQIHLWPIQHQEWHYRAPWQLATCENQRPVLSTTDGITHYLRQAEQAWQARDIHQTYVALQQLHPLPSGENRDRAFELWSQLYLHLPRQQLRATWPLYTFAAHVGAIQQLLFEREDALITSSRNGTVKRWSLQSERALGTIIGQPRGWLHCFSLSRDRQWLLTSSQRDGLQKWQTRSGQRPQALTTVGEPPLCVVELPASPYILGGTAQGQLQLWHLETGNCLRTWPAHNQAIIALCSSPDGEYGVSAEADRVWKRWHLTTGQCVQVISTAQSGITTIVYSSDGQHIVTAAQDHSVMVWHATTGKRLHTLRGHHSPVTTVCLSQDSRYVLSGDEAGVAHLWNLRTGVNLQTWCLENSGITAVALSRTCKYVVLGTATGDVHLWALEWQLAPPMKPHWDETARPYLEAFLRRQIPRQLIQPRAQILQFPPPQPLQEFPLEMLVFWIVLIWLGSITSYEIFVNTAYPVGTSLLAGGTAMFVWSYFTGRQRGNPTVQLGALFGIVVLALVGIVERFQQGWTALGAVCWGAITALLMTGPCLGLWHSQPAIRPLGLNSSQSLKKYLGRNGATLLLLFTVVLGISFEWVMVQGAIPRFWPVVGVGLAGACIEAIALWRQTWQPQRLLKHLVILGLIILTSFTWLLPSRLGVVPQRACDTLSGLMDYLGRGGTPNGQLLTSSPPHSLLECALAHQEPTFLKTLIEHRAQLDQLNPQGEGILHIAVQMQSIPAIKSLLAAKSPINLPDSQGRLAIHYARTAPIIRLLIQAGANVNALAPQLGSPLQQAIRDDQLESAQMLLSHQANPNLTCDEQQCEEYSAIYSAIRHERWEILQLLLTYDVDLTIRDRNQQTPLDYAQSLNRTKAVSIIQNAIEPEF